MEKYLSIKKDYLKLKSIYDDSKIMKGGRCYNPTSDMHVLLQDHLDLFNVSQTIPQESLTLTTKMIGMATNNTCDMVEVSKRLKGKIILVIDFANIIGQLINEKYGSGYQLKDLDVIYIESLFYKYLKNKLLSDDYLVYIIAKPYKNILIEDIVNALINDKSNKIDMTKRVINNLFVYRTRYYDQINNQIMIISGGIDDFIFWFFCILFHNISILFGKKLEILTFDKQSRYTSKNLKTLFSDIIPSEESIDKYYQKEFTKKAGFVRPNRSDITLIIDQLVPDLYYERCAFYRDEISTKYFNDITLLFNNEIIDNGLVKTTGGTTLSINLMKYYNKSLNRPSLFKGETEKITLFVLLKNYTNLKPEDILSALIFDDSDYENLEKTRRFIEVKKILLLHPLIVVQGEEIIQLIIKFLFYLDILQYFYFGKIEGSYQTDRFKMDFNMLGFVPREHIKRDQDLYDYYEYKIHYVPNTLIDDLNNSISHVVNLEPHLKELNTILDKKAEQTQVSYINPITKEEFVLKIDEEGDVKIT